MSRRPSADGRVVEVLEHASRGDEIVLDVRQEMVLDAQGALCVAGATMEELEDEERRRIEAYQSARRSLDGVQG